MVLVNKTHALPEGFEPMLIIAMAPGGFIIFGAFIGCMNFLLGKLGREKGGDAL